jgi:hypothetical protein
MICGRVTRRPGRQRSSSDALSLHEFIGGVMRVIFIGATRA